MTYLKPQRFLPNSSEQYRKRRNTKKQNKESIINIEDLTLDKRQNPVPAQPWLRRPEKFYECFSISGLLSAKQDTKYETFYSYPKQRQDFLTSFLPFCFPNGISEPPKKYYYPAKQSSTIPKYSALIGSESEHFIFMLTNYESLLYGYCVKVLYPFSFLPSFVKKGHPIFQRKRQRGSVRKHKQTRNKLQTSKKPNTKQREMKKSKTDGNFTSQGIKRKNQKERRERLKSFGELPSNLKWEKRFRKRLHKNKPFYLVPLCFCLISKTSFIDLNFEILHSIIAYTNLELLRMNIFREIYFSKDTINRCLTFVDQKKKNSLYGVSSFRPPRRASVDSFIGNPLFPQKPRRKKISYSTPQVSTFHIQYLDDHVPKISESTLKKRFNDKKNENKERKKGNGRRKNNTTKSQCDQKSETNFEFNDWIVINEYDQYSDKKNDYFKRNDNKNKKRDQNKKEKEKRKEKDKEKDKKEKKKEKKEKKKKKEKNKKKEKKEKKDKKDKKDKKEKKKKKEKKEKKKKKEKEEKKDKKENGEKGKENDEEEKREDNKHLIIEFLSQLKVKKIPMSRDIMFLSVGGELKRLTYLIPEDLENKKAIFSFKWFFSILSLENILEIIRFTLLEKTIVFVSDSLRALSIASFSIPPIIFPFQWQGAIMPIIPSNFRFVVDSPVPVMTGLTEWETSEEKNFTSDYLLVNLDHNTCKFNFNSKKFTNKKNNKNKNDNKSYFKNTNHLNNTLPKLPSYLELLNSLKKAFKNSKTRNNFPTFIKCRKRGKHAILFLTKNLKSNYFVDHHEEKLIGEIQAIFAKYFNLLVADFRNHTFSDVSSKDICSIFLPQSFLESVIEKDHPFMELFLKSQSFQHFCNQQLAKIQKSLARKISRKLLNEKLKNIETNQNKNINKNGHGEENEGEEN
ncbi:suppression of tumorigenicity 5 st5 [Anaeramoeba flamelloides]|uniref:Suppression of tumorigenicity 5 st5 n=1 Tax=Anaeramoeba flamelloides TaxID=1746091 RepID=A0ABQ8XXV3_9EUKA|nr:suppression of tumorigenicity 5 st5 [Anaeramoeba flamelloides]